MPKAKPLDEILGALPGVGLQLWMLCDNTPAEKPEENWYVVLHDIGKAPVEPYCHDGNGETALACLTAALTAAGVDVEDSA